MARLHINMGHPSTQELVLVRLACFHGSPSTQVVDAVRKLRCSTCERLSKVQPPRPAALPQVQPRQFADEVQGDVVWVRLTSGTAAAVLGLVDVATKFHQACVLDNRSSEEVFQRVHETWFKPFGLPVKLHVDPDKSFHGEFQQRVEAMGIDLQFCPPEAHALADSHRGAA